MAASSLPALVAADPTLALGLLVRMAAVVAGGGLAMFPRIDLRVQAALAIALAAAALPLAAVAPPVGRPTTLPLVAGEAAIGLGLGLAVAVVFAAAAWAGGLLGSVAGLSWADDFTPDSGAGQGGAAALAGWLAVAGFLAAGGHLAVIGGLLESVARFPVGCLAAAGPGGLLELIRPLPAAALELAFALAAPALLAVLAFHVTAALCLRSVNFAAGAGLIQAAASLVLLAAVWQAAASWTGGFATAVHRQLDQSLSELRP